MNFEKLDLSGVMLVKKKIHRDERGSLFKTYSKSDLSKNEIEIDISEVLYSTSRLNVIRGMHFQFPPYEQAKFISVVKGKITDVLLDIRSYSISYGKFMSVELSEYDGLAVYIPKGIAHGFVSRVDYSTVLYIIGGAYSPLKEAGIRYDSFGFEWEVDEPILSSRDLAFPDFSQFKSRFLV